MENRRNTWLVTRCKDLANYLNCFCSDIYSTRLFFFNLSEITLPSTEVLN